MDLERGLTTAWEKVGRLREERILPPIRLVRRARCVPTPLYICGATGSGTTLLAYKLVEQLAVSGIVRESGLQVSRRSLLRLPAIDEHASLADYKQSLMPKPDWDSEDSRRTLLRLYRSRMHGSDGPVVDKGPNSNLVRAPFLKTLFPEAAFIILLRDPAANIEGMRRKWSLFGRAPLVDVIDFYNWLHAPALDLLGFTTNFVVLTYEALVEDPSRILQWVGDRLSIPHGGSTIRSASRLDRPGRGLRNVRRGKIEVSRGTNEFARRGLSGSELSLINDRVRSALGDLWSQATDQFREDIR